MIATLFTIALALDAAVNRVTDTTPRSESSGIGGILWGLRIGIFTLADTAVLAGSSSGALQALSAAVAIGTTARGIATLRPTASTFVCIRVALPALAAAPALLTISI